MGVTEDAEKGELVTEVTKIEAGKCAPVTECDNLKGNKERMDGRVEALNR